MPRASVSGSRPSPLGMYGLVASLLFHLAEDFPSSVRILGLETSERERPTHFRRQDSVSPRLLSHLMVRHLSRAVRYFLFSEAKGYIFSSPSRHFPPFFHSMAALAPEITIAEAELRSERAFLFGESCFSFLPLHFGCDIPRRLPRRLSERNPLILIIASPSGGGKGKPLTSLCLLSFSALSAEKTALEDLMRWRETKFATASFTGEEETREGNFFPSLSRGRTR